MAEIDQFIWEHPSGLSLVQNGLPAQIQPFMLDCFLDDPDAQVEVKYHHQLQALIRYFQFN